MQDFRWGKHIDVHHQNNDHGDNALVNLFCWKANGPEGHRSFSARFAAQERAARQRQFENAEGEEEDERKVDEELHHL